MGGGKRERESERRVCAVGVREGDVSGWVGKDFMDIFKSKIERKGSGKGKFK